MEDIFNLKGKVAIVTGASSGLGTQFAKALAKQGATVVIVARRVEKLEKLAEEIKQLGVDCLPIMCDVTEEDDIKTAVEGTIKEFGKIDILVNNAGVASTGPTEDFPVEEWEKVINTNLTGVFLFSKHVGKHMIENKYGKIINISSIAGFLGFEGMSTAAYSASKGAVVNLTRALADEWGKYNIYVNSIAPGFFPSEMTQAYTDNDQFTGYVKSRTSLDRWGKDGELNGALIYFASDASSYTTGQILPVDGGWTAE
jgi:NAD(P)-dependent dehydrogenase (short-subunit alcohol dehydrogenase family)